jgi:segregation and condensation protein B
MDDHDNVIHLPGLGPAAPARAPVPDAGDEAQAPEGPPPSHMVEAVVEAVLFAADRPLSEAEIERVLVQPAPGAVREALEDLRARWRHGAGGIALVEVAHGWQLRTSPHAAPWVAALRGGRPFRLSRAALEALAIVGYRQPITRAEVDDLRGVDSSGTLRMLIERELVAPVGRSDDPGRPLLYGTTPRFLEVFGLRDLCELPALRDLREMEERRLREEEAALGQMQLALGGGEEDPLPTD